MLFTKQADNVWMRELFHEFSFFFEPLNYIRVFAVKSLHSH